MNPPAGTRATVTGLAAAHLVTDIYMPVLPAILPLLVATDGYTYLAAGLLVTTYNLTSSCIQPVVGWLSDKRGFAVPVSLSLLISAVFIALMGTTSQYGLIMLFAIIAALGHACFHPTALSIVSRCCTPGNRGRITSYFVVGGNIGYALGPVIAAALVWWLGLPGLLFIVIPGVLMAGALRYILPGGIEGARQATKSAAPPAGAPVSYRPFALLMVVSVLRAWSVFAAITYLPLFLVQQGYSLVAASTIVTLMLLCGVAGQLFGGRISDAIGRREFMIAGLVLAIPFFYLFYAGSGIAAIAALMIFGFFLWSTFAVAVAMGHELLPGNVGLASGMMLGLAIGVGGLGVAVNGLIADHWSLAAALATVPLPLAIATVFMFLLPYPWKALGRRGHAPA